MSRILQFLIPKKKEERKEKKKYSRWREVVFTHTLLIIFRNISPPTDLEPKSKYTFISGSRGGLNLLE